jgi:uncharacterized RDD family membrane protein YckC
VADLSAFTAAPRKRLSAAFVDFMLAGLAAALVYALGQEAGRRLNFEILFGVAFFVYHCAFLHFSAGQSPGRHLVDITVISAQGADLQPWQAIARSLLRPALIAAASVSTHPAGRFGLAAPVVTVVLALELGLLFSLRSRRTIADLVAGTLVVNTPPLQPHRAPAAPMYSAGDAEFGYAPRKPKGMREGARR